MAANNKTQMVLSHDDTIIVSNGLQPPVTSAYQPSVMFIHLIKFALSRIKPHVVIFTDSTFLGTEFRHWKWSGIYVCVYAEYQRPAVIAGMALHLNCSSPCLPDDVTVTWSLLLNHTGRAVTLPTEGSAEYVLSVDNSLVVVSVNASRHEGTFQCSYNNRILTKHRVSLSGRLFTIQFSLFYSTRSVS